MLIADIWQLSLHVAGGMDARYVSEYSVVKDFSKHTGFDFLEVYRVCKSMSSKFNEKV